MNVVRGAMTVTRDSVYFAYLFTVDIDGSEAVKANVSLHKSRFQKLPSR